MSNPVHPKVLGGLGGTLVGGGVGQVIDTVIEQTHAFTDLSSNAQTTVHGLLVVGIAALGQFIVSYFSKWAPAQAILADLGELSATVAPNIPSTTEAPTAPDPAIAVGEAPQATD